MRGHVRKRKTWEYVVELEADPTTGRRRQKSKAGFRTKKLAEQALADVLHALDTGSFVEPAKLTVGAYLEAWLTSAKARLRPGAYDACAMHVRVYLNPRIGTLPLQQLTPTRVRALYAELRESGRVRTPEKPLSPKTVHNIHRTLSKALDDAVSDLLLMRNPAAGASQLPESPTQDTWSPEQLQHFLQVLQTDRLYAMWRLAAATGMRRGELAGLRWIDVDFHARRVNLVQQRAKGGGGVVQGKLKGKRGRAVALDDATLVALGAHRARQNEERLALGPAWHDEGLVFCRPDGSGFHPDQITQAFKRAARVAGLPYIKAHGLRHSYATLALRAGIPSKIVAERLGHSSTAITDDIYAHVTPDMQADAAARVAALLDRRMDPAHPAVGTGRAQASSPAEPPGPTTP